MQRNRIKRRVEQSTVEYSTVDYRGWLSRVELRGAEWSPVVKQSDTYTVCEGERERLVCYCRRAQQGGAKQNAVSKHASMFADVPEIHYCIRVHWCSVVLWVLAIESAAASLWHCGAPHREFCPLGCVAGSLYPCVLQKSRARVHSLEFVLVIMLLLAMALQNLGKLHVRCKQSDPLCASRVI